jgi:hypothetical protein
LEVPLTTEEVLKATVHRSLHTKIYAFSFVLSRMEGWEVQESLHPLLCSSIIGCCWLSTPH